MSKIEVTLNAGILTIEKKTSRVNSENIEPIQVNILEYGREYHSKLRITNPDEKNEIFFLQRVNNADIQNTSTNKEIAKGKEENSVIIVYSKNGKIIYSYCSEEKAYKKFVKLRFRVLKLSLNKKKIKIKVLAYIVNPYQRDIKYEKFYIDEKLYKECNLKQYQSKISKSKMLRENNIYTFRFDMEDVIKDESIINGAIRFCLNIDGVDVEYRIAIFDKKIKQKRYYKIPLETTYVKDFAVHIRRTISGNLVLVKRKIEPIEQTMRFKILESKLVSAIMYHVGKIFSKLRRKKINLFYEKFASKAEEGVYEICQKCQKSSKTKNYFVIGKESPYYEKLKEDKHVVPKYSLKYYWLFYNTTHFIASEVPSHLNILRSNNKYFRRATYDKKLIFLQHGIIYMKNLGKKSVFVKGEEGEAQYMIVSSQKEKDIVADMLKYDENQILKTGLGMFSKIEYNHINMNSEDIITVMLTYKDYEEQLYNFEESSYYKNVCEIYNLLTKYFDKNKIIIIGHPKANGLLINTDMKEQLWEAPISEALKKTKLLITDYSSICYNAFYQGAGVIFYQNDLQKYETENGPLIPNDDEYIGERAFDINELENIIKDTITDGKIILDKVRTKEHENIYKTINEFNDGRNIDRIYEELLSKNIV